MKFPSFHERFKHIVTRIRIPRECAQRRVHLLQQTVPNAPRSSSASFEDLGLHPPIVTALRRAFPNVTRPTEPQAKFIPAVLCGKDVLLRDFTGSGKSFGLTIALLNKPRIRSTGESQELHHITSLVIVPHRDLAFQYLHWIERVVACAEFEPLPELKSVAQVLVRDGGAHLTTGLASLHETAPHILIGTPQALMDVWKQDQKALQLPRLSTVVVDEVDYLVETLPKKDPNKTFRPAVIRAAKKLVAHPGVTRELLDEIYAKRKQLSDDRRDEPGLVQLRRRIGLEEEVPRVTSPQLVMCSATLRGHLRTHLFQESGWLNKDNLTVFKGTEITVPSSEEAVSKKSKKINVIGGNGVTHSVLVVSDNVIVNVEGALMPQASALETGRDHDVTPEAIFGSVTVPEQLDLDEKLVEKYEKTPSPFNPNSLEAIATAFALDVPCIALLVLPASAPIQRAVHELRGIGVNAHALDLLNDEKGKKHLLHNASKIVENPTLLVSTLATTRGIDLPELSHVFILGIPEGPKVTARAIDAYLHIAGRVGRFGRGGKVVTIISTEDDVEKMNRILKTIEVAPVRFEHFD